MIRRTLLRGPAAAILVAGLLGACGESEPAGTRPGDPEFVARGKALYESNCADGCHGMDLEGQPDWRSELPEGGLPAPPHDESGHTWHHDDDLLFRYTKLGGQALVPPDFKSNMPAFGDVLSDQEIWAILSYIQSRWPDEVLARQQSMTERARQQRKER